jgi:D-amino-acid dehydrogenase
MAYRNVVVIGAGIVGVSCALVLQRDGHGVTLLDRGPPGQGASFGNGSVLVASACVPLQSPGMARRVPGMLVDPLGPLTIRWRYLPRLLPWLARFVAAGTPAKVERASKALAALAEGSVEAQLALLEPLGAAAMIERHGWVCVYETEASFRRAAPELALERRRGVRAEVLDADGLAALEPALARIFARAVWYPDVAHSVNVYRMVKVMAEGFLARGGRLVRAEARGFACGPQGPHQVFTDAEPVHCDAVVVAAGAWSKPLAAALGAPVTLDTERGYHVDLPDPGVAPRLPVYSTERGIVVTPLEHGLRAAGTVEFAGLEAAPHWRRADVLLHHARRWFPGLGEDGASRWMGFRPSLPDSVPVIARSPRHANAFLAFGHGHLGVSFAARTAELIAALTGDRDPGIDMAPYAAGR